GRPDVAAAGQLVAVHAHRPVDPDGGRAGAQCRDCPPVALFPDIHVARVPVVPVAVELPAEPDDRVATAVFHEVLAEPAPVLVIGTGSTVTLVATTFRPQRLGDRNLARPDVPGEGVERPGRRLDAAPVPAGREDHGESHRPAGPGGPRLDLRGEVAV